MNKYLYKIGNTILLNSQYNHSKYNHSNGLLNGKMGICIFLYHLSRYMKNDQYKYFADNLLEDIIASLHDKDLSFVDGLCGIAFGINYLIHNKFIDGNPEDILEDIERIIFDNLEKQTQNDLLSDYPLFSTGLYITSKHLYDKDEEVVTRLLDTCGALLNNRDTFKHITTSMLISILYVLSFLHNNGMERYSQRTMDILTLLLKKIPIPENKKDRRIFYYLLNCSPIYTDHKKSFIPYEPNCLQGIFLWEELLYFKNEYPELDERKVKDSIENIIWGDLVNNLSINGLSGIGLNIIRQEHLKNKYK